MHSFLSGLFNFLIAVALTTGLWLSAGAQDKRWWIVTAMCAIGLYFYAIYDDLMKVM